MQDVSNTMNKTASTTNRARRTPRFCRSSEKSNALLTSLQKRRRGASETAARPIFTSCLGVYSTCGAPDEGADASANGDETAGRSAVATRLPPELSSVVATAIPCCGMVNIRPHLLHLTDWPSFPPGGCTGRHTCRCTWPWVADLAFKPRASRLMNLTGLPRPPARSETEGPTTTPGPFSRATQ